MKLIRLKSNYADIYSFAVMKQKDIENVLELVKMHFEVFPNDKLEFSFGSYSELAFDSYENYKDSFEIVDLPNSESEALMVLFPPRFPNNCISASFGCDYFYDKYGLIERISEAEENKSILNRIREIAPDCFDENGEWI